MGVGNQVFHLVIKMPEAVSELTSESGIRSAFYTIGRSGKKQMSYRNAKNVERAKLLACMHVIRSRPSAKPVLADSYYFFDHQHRLFGRFDTE